MDDFFYPGRDQKHKYGPETHSRLRVVWVVVAFLVFGCCVWFLLFDHVISSRVGLAVNVALTRVTTICVVSLFGLVPFHFFLMVFLSRVERVVLSQRSPWLIVCWGITAFELVVVGGYLILLLLFFCHMMRLPPNFHLS